MDQYKTPESGRRLATVLLGADDMGRPMFAPPNMPTDRLKTLRDAFVKTMQDEQFRAEVKNAAMSSIRWLGKNWRSWPKT
jgi:tripartite-type tricarboxylate transporter receptor subunit TctC